MARNTYVLITKSLLVSVFLLSRAKLCLYCMQTFFKRQKNNVNDNCVWLLTKCVFLILDLKITMLKVIASSQNSS